MKSFVLRRHQLLTDKIKENIKVKAAALANKPKHGVSKGVLRFFSDEKLFKTGR